ncbi:hypothetical protein [Herminiimonas aquatilis]|uniref:Uncharacterized protein n=1 Tax=Herminiimonas aquatilis TaxID=345342 RepID=A0ABW2J4E3_9BURK
MLEPAPAESELLCPRTKVARFHYDNMASLRAKPWGPFKLIFYNRLTICVSNFCIDRIPENNSVSYCLLIIDRTCGGATSALREPEINKKAADLISGQPLFCSLKHSF